MDRCTSKLRQRKASKVWNPQLPRPSACFTCWTAPAGVFGALSWARSSTNRTNIFTGVSSCHHTALGKRATEYQKEPTGRGGPGLRTVAPPSTLDELLHLERSRGEGGLSDDAVVATCETYGPVPRRLPDCRSAADQDEYCMTMALLRAPEHGARPSESLRSQPLPSATHPCGSLDDLRLRGCDGIRPVSLSRHGVGFQLTASCC